MATNPTPNNTYVITPTTGGPITIAADTFELSADGTVLIFSTRSPNQNPANPLLLSSQFLFLKSNVTEVDYVGPAAGFNLGGVNNQTGTSYTVAASDNGGIVTLDNASPVAVTLPATIAAGFFGSVENLGAGLATLTPTTGTINGASDITLVTNQSAFLYFDGTNWWAATSAGSGSGYSLGGTLSGANIVAGAGAGTGATISVTGLDGNHTVEITIGTAPVINSTLFTVTFTTSRGHGVWPVIAAVGSIGYSSLSQSIVFATGSATAYTFNSGSVALATGVSYVWNVSCP